MANEPGSPSDGFGNDENRPKDRGDSHLTGSERADPTRRETRRTGDTGRTDPKSAGARSGAAAGATAAGDPVRKAETYRPKAETRSGATASERVQPKKGFNPAWLLVPAAGLLLGGLGIANMNREPDAATPSASVTMPSATMPSATMPGASGSAQPVAPAASVTTAPATVGAGCRIAFTGTRFEEPISRLKNIRTGEWLNAPSGRQFVVVNTTIRNRGEGTCWATPGYQRGYTSANTYYGGSTTAGNELYRGRRMTKAVGSGNQTTGAYVFVVPVGKNLTQVGFRANGSTDWTIVRK
ncbi:DUF4352 domain-containing protein [Actinocorallia longicatena]|uniref:DUF4352 domain-containing protein n=1 Tax=Actinocorallia longicatena TaxID=111803 RepID=A0ABP6QJV8_9ACTN